MTNTMRTMLLAAMLTGCTSAKPIVLPNGSTGQMIECDGTANSMASCIEKAGEICPKGYTVQDSDEQRGVMSLPTSTGGFNAVATANRYLIVSCK